MAGMPIWYELMTSDPAAVAGFYRATLGWTVPPQGEAMPNGVHYGQIARADGSSAGGVLTLSAEMQACGARTRWIPYFDVEDVDAAAAEVERLGGSVQMPPVSLEGVGRMAMLGDPQGAPFYLMAPTPPPGQPDAKSDAFDPVKAGHCRWNELNTTDAAGALAFYEALLGWTRGMAMPMGEAGDYQFVEHDGIALGAVNPVREGPSYWLPIFGVADIEAARAAAAETGGRITVDLQEIPGGEFALNVDDPGGAALGFVGPKGGSQ
ncbi:VOC family protein [Sphingosinicella sp. BN140058]|uniref:VOC family protein n=1 Tax=Sphingosinicella sp. BN140058 TaxID=1892855 RepID=UPI0010105F75|nr:VOC family protein [Sphingosinicella sp. BN140058]QAY75220.1 VOC family protein [Sphingosinicella sp. BN140058]